jgi:hypothetical protein
MRPRALLALAAVLLLALPAAAASAAPAPDLLSFDAGHARLSGHGNRVQIRLYGVEKASQLAARPLHRIGRRLGPRGIVAAAKRHATLSFEVPRGPWWADSMLIRVRGLKAHRGLLVVRGNRIAASHLPRARRTFNEPDRTLPSRTGRVSLMLDNRPEDPPVRTVDGRSAVDPVIGVLRAPPPRRGRIGNFYGAPGPGHPQPIIFKWIEKAHLECTAYTLADAPINLVVEDNFESQSVKPTLLEAPRDGELIRLSTPAPKIPFGSSTVDGFKGSFSIDVEFPSRVMAEFNVWVGPLPPGASGIGGGLTETFCTGSAPETPPPLPRIESGPEGAPPIIASINPNEGEEEERRR